VYKSTISGDNDLTEVLLKKMNGNTYCNKVIHSLWEKHKNIKIT